MTDPRPTSSHPDSTPPALTALSGFIVDLDGTLILSNDAHARAWQAALQGEGLPRRYEEVRPLIGMGADQLLPRLADVEADSEQGKRLQAAWKRAFVPLIPTLRAAPGARALLQALQASGLPYMLGSSGESGVMDALLEQADVSDLIDRRVTSNDVERSKPSPDIVRAALSQLGLEPGGVLMIGDTVYDAASAQQAGARCALVRSGGSLDGNPAGDGAPLPEGALICADPAELARLIARATRAG